MSFHSQGMSGPPSRRVIQTRFGETAFAASGAYMLNQYWHVD
jgi:hypothetical protein